MKRSSDRGFTLVELMFGIAILAIVGLMVGQLIASASRMYRSTIAFADIQTESQMVSRRIGSAVMNAEGIYLDETAEGIILFTGEQVEEESSISYSGEIFWFDKDTGCLYQNSSFVMSQDAGTGSGSFGSLSVKSVKESMEHSAGGGREYRISDKVKSMEFETSADLKAENEIETGSGYYVVEGNVTISYTIEFQYLDSDQYVMSAGATPRNRIGLFRWKKGDASE